MYSSKLKTMVVSDLLEINKVVKRLQENAGLTLDSGSEARSTLAAETQSLARGVGEMIWAQVVYLEITEPSFNLRDWQHQARERGYLALASEGSQETLQQALAL